MKTVALKKADGIVKMIVLAGEDGKPLHFTKAAATLEALKADGLSVSRDNYSSTEVFDKRGKYVKAVYDKYFVRVRP